MMKLSKNGTGKRVFVAMSGGVDSSVAAMILKGTGYNVTGVFMRCYNLDGCAEQDAEDARRVAAHLEIPFYVFDFEEEYKREVVDYMVQGYKEGRTPNPDVMCNKHIKFGLFLKKARALGADYIATGHYVRLRNLSLWGAKDTNKDQSYFLWTLRKEELQYCLFPIGDYTKPEVRILARKAGLPTAEKKDSQGICFLGQVELSEFLKQYIPEEKGAIVTTAGEEIGEHRGAYAYTIGQRHGLGVGGGEPYYVSEKNVQANILTVARGKEHSALFKKELTLTNLNFLSGTPYEGEVFAHVRYRQPVTKATLKKLETGNWKIIFNTPQKFVASGQSAVMYTKSGEMLGGGVIL